MEVVQQWLAAAWAAALGWGIEEWILAVGVALLAVALLLWFQVQRQFRIERGIWRLLLDLQYDIRRLRDELSDADVRLLREEVERRDRATAVPPPAPQDAPSAEPDAEATAAPAAETLDPPADGAEPGPAQPPSAAPRPGDAAARGGDAIGAALESLERVEARLRHPPGERPGRR